MIKPPKRAALVVSAFLQCLLHPGNRFDEVLEDGLFAGFDVHGCDHTGDDAQFFAVFVGEVAVFGFDEDTVVGLVGIEVEFAAAAFVAQGIRADEGNGAVQAAIDGIVVSGEFDDGG